MVDVGLKIMLLSCMWIILYTYGVCFYFIVTSTWKDIKDKNIPGILAGICLGSVITFFALGLNIMLANLLVGVTRV